MNVRLGYSNTFNGHSMISFINTLSARSTLVVLHWYKNLLSAINSTGLNTTDVRYSHLMMYSIGNNLSN